VTDARKTLISIVSLVTRQHHILTHPRRRALCLDIHGPYNLVSLNEINLWHLPNPLNDSVGEHSGVALDMAVIHMTKARFDITDGLERVKLMSHCQEVEMVVHYARRHVMLEHNDI